MVNGLYMSGQVWRVYMELKMGEYLEITMATAFLLLMIMALAKLRLKELGLYS